MKRLLPLLLLLISFGSFAQNYPQRLADVTAPTLSYYLPDSVSYNPTVPTPQSVLGFVPGEWHVSYDKLLFYAQAIAAASPRIQLVKQGRSYEGRHTVLLVVTSEANHTRLEEIKAQHVALTDPARSANLNIADMPSIAWMGYSIHGNEPSGSNAVPLVLYHLAAAQGPDIEQTLKNTVILIDPSFNPDGLQRFSSWVNMHKNLTPTANADDREYNEEWPRGRTNHYWFDLNRDWLPAQHPESQARVATFHSWKPNIVTDHHEMGTNATFFFQPGIPSRTNPLTPQLNQELTGLITNHHAQRLDNIGSSYYTRESFDDFYYGKGSTYPDVQGAMGILFEQASSRGHIQESDNGLLTFPFTIRNQFTASLATIEAAQKLRPQLLNYQRNFYKNAMDDARKADNKAWVFAAPADAMRAYHLREMLNRHQIKVHKLAQSVNVNGTRFSPETSWVVPLEQPQHRLIRAMFEQQTSFTDSLFYDVSAWTLPLAFNLDFAPLSARSYSSSLFGAADALTKPTGAVVGGESQVGYTFSWSGYYTPRALYQLQRAGVKAKVSESPTSYQLTNGSTNSSSYGTIIIPTGIQSMQSDKLHSLLQQVAEENSIDIYAVGKGLGVGGPDIGSRGFSLVQQPEVALLVGDGIDYSEAGEMWHLLDQRYHIPVTKIDVDNFRSADLNRFTHLLMPDGSYSIDKEAVKSWVRQGGVVVAVKGAASWADNAGLLSLEYKKPESDTTSKRPYASLSNDRGSQVIGGSIFQAELDISHPLGYGYTRSSLPVFRDNTRFFELPKNAYATPLRYTDNPLLSGYISKRMKPVASNAAGIVVGSYGRGRIIAFADNPNFRAFWYGTNKLFANALFFGNQISSAATVRGE